MIKRYNLLVLLISSCLFMSSCISRKEISYFQTAGDSTMVQNIEAPYEAVLQAGDIISIHVSSLSNDASSFFNQPDARGDGLGMTTYLVSAAGTISFPLLGNVHVAGRTTQVLTNELVTALSKYLVEPGVRIRLQSFRVTILGEVARPGVYPISTERVSLMEAIGLAGDLTVYGKRKNVLLIREENGKRTFTRVDMTNPSVFLSDAYQLHNNDVVYIEPGKGKVASAEEVYRILPIIFSGLTVVGLFLQRVL